MVNLIDVCWKIYDELYVEGWSAHGTSSSADFYKIAKIHALAPAKQGQANILQNKNAPKRLHSCLFCKKKPKFHILDGGTIFNYCNKHFNKCSVRGCNKDANHTRADSMRVCHDHARGIQGCHTDKVLREKGCTVEAVK